jgi:hypothetical protein
VVLYAAFGSEPALHPGEDGRTITCGCCGLSAWQSNRERRAKGSNKSLVFGMVGRKGMLRTGPVSDVSQNTLEPIVRGHVIEGTTISADELRSYSDLKHGFELGRVNHFKKQWVNGVHHTNTLEGHWSHFKCAVRGTHIHISAKHM